MQAHQIRVVDEKADLDMKLDKLTAFMAGEAFARLDIDEQARMRRQGRAMVDYSAVLGERIGAFRKAG